MLLPHGPFTPSQNVRSKKSNIPGGSGNGVKVKQGSVQRVALVPWQIVPPTGYEALKALATNSAVAPVPIEA
jgi:hypothetical protein